MKKIRKLLLVTSLIGTQLMLPLQTVFAEDTTSTLNSHITSRAMGDLTYESEGMIYIDKNGEQISLDDIDDYTSIYYPLSDNTVTLVDAPLGLIDGSTELVIPSKINANDKEYTVVQLGHEDYDYPLRLTLWTTVTLPNTIKEIPDGLFNQAKTLTTVNLPDSITKIGANAFFECTDLEEITIPKNVKSIGNNAFTHCISLKTVNLPDGLEEIGDEAFGEFYSTLSIPVGLPALTNITIPDSVTKIGKGAFSVSGLKSIRLPENLTEISDRMFTYCQNLESITLPKSVKTIGTQAFSYCKGLKILNIPYGVETIKGHAFQFCSNLEEIIIPSSVKTIEELAFALTRNNDIYANLNKVRIYGDGSQLTINDYGNFRNTNGSKYHDAFDIILDNNFNNETLTTFFKQCTDESKVQKVAAPKVSFYINDVQYGDAVDYDNGSYKLPDIVNKGWYEASNASKDNDSDNYKVTLTLKEFSITYDGLDNATFDGGSNTNPTSFTQDTKQVSLINPKKEGYIFKGWVDSDGNKVTYVPFTTAGDKTLTATWEKELNKITSVDIVDASERKLSSGDATNKDVTVTVNYARNETDWTHSYMISNKDNAEWTTLNNDHKITINDPGEYVIKFKSSYDGKEQEQAMQIKVLIDTVAPDFTILKDKTSQNYFGMETGYRNDPSNSAETPASYGVTLTINGELFVFAGSNPKYVGPTDKDTLYTFVLTDRAGNSSTYNYTMLALPSVDDITINDLTLIANIKNELDGKITNNFFNDTDTDVTSLQTKVKALTTRYDKLIALADANELLAAAKVVTTENINSGTAEMLAKISDGLEKKLQKLNSVENPNDGEKEAIVTIQTEINRIKDMLSYHKEVMKNYDTVLVNANALSKLEVTLGNVAIVNDQLTDISEFIDTHKQNLTGEEVVALTTLTSKVNSEFTELSKAQNELSSLLNIAKNLDSSLYVKESVDTLNKAIENANNVLEEESTTLDDLTKTLNILSEAIDGLEKVVTEPTTPVDPEQPNKTTPSTDTNKGVDTGDTTSTNALFALMGLAVIAIGSLGVRRKFNK